MSYIEETDYTKHLRAEQATWAKVIRQAGIRGK